VKEQFCFPDGQIRTWTGKGDCHILTQDVANISYYPILALAALFSALSFLLTAAYITPCRMDFKLSNHTYPYSTSMAGPTFCLSLLILLQHLHNESFDLICSFPCERCT
jgi:hypothetical protein